MTDKRKLCVYLSDDIDYTKVKMFALIHQVSISKLIEDSLIHMMEDDADDIIDFYYKEGGF